MPRTPRSRRILVLSFLLGAGAACGDDPSSPGDPPEVSIAAPGEGTRWGVGQPIDFVGSATVAAGDDVTLSWRSDRDGEIGSSDSIEFASLSAGQHVITLRAEDETGAVGRDSVVIDVIDIGCPSGDLDLGESVNGSLTATDCPLGDGTWVDLWRIHLRERRAVRMVLESSQFDAYLFVMDVEGNFEGDNDDGAGGTNALIDIVLSEGTHYILANSYDVGGTGTYRLTVNEGTATDCPAQPTTVPASITAALAEGDCVLSDGSLYDAWGFELAAPARVRITMRSSAFDTVLGLFTSGWGLVAADDDGGGGTDSRLERDLPAGSYIVATTSFSPGDIGSYTLVLERVGSVQVAAGSAAASGSITTSGKALELSRRGRIEQRLGRARMPAGDFRDAARAKRRK